MIQVTSKVHDNFSIEFKIGFVGKESANTSDFSVNSWIFVPNNLNINASTYSKELFYRDVKSNIRLITPSLTPCELADPEAMPFCNLHHAADRVIQTPSTFALQEFEFQIKMFASIFKSTLRDEIRRINSCSDPTVKRETIDALTRHIRTITTEYRALGKALEDNNLSARDIYRQGDEFISHLIGMQVVKLYKRIEPDHYKAEKEQLMQLIREESDYKCRQGYSLASPYNKEGNDELVYRHSLLKKYIESALYLKVQSTPDGDAAKQITFGFAAGIAMILSTLIALPFQRYLGSSPMIIFMVLVVAYMFKDRIKEIVRNQFAYQLKQKYFDQKNKLDFQDHNIGYIKEGMDFINDEKTPPEALRRRNRSPLEADNGLFEEKTILYRKNIHIDTQYLRNQNEYRFSGIHDIMRFHIQQFTQKMDDPVVQLESVGADNHIEDIEAQRVYPIHIVMQFGYDGNTEYHTFRIVATRNGILRCDKLTEA